MMMSPGERRVSRSPSVGIDGGGWHHQPDDARCAQLGDEIVERGRADGAFSRERCAPRRLIGRRRRRCGRRA